MIGKKSSAQEEAKKNDCNCWALNIVFSLLIFLYFMIKVSVYDYRFLWWMYSSWIFVVSKNKFLKENIRKIWKIKQKVKKNHKFKINIGKLANK